MRVLFLHRQPCMRTLKYAVALRARVPSVDLHYAYQGETLSGFYGTGDELFSSWHRLGVDPVDDLARALDEVRPDLIHSHNLPDVLTVEAQRLVGGRVPIIHDVHDFASLRHTPYEDGYPETPDPVGAERAAIEQSDAVITVGPELLEQMEARYRVPAVRALIPNYALLRDLPDLGIEGPPPAAGRPLRIAYQGTLSVGHGHYDLRDIFARIAGQGIELHVHPARPPLPEYRELAGRFPNIHVHEPLPPEALLAALPVYDAGWAGFNERLNAEHLATVLPNKAFEYVGCGLPVITLPHRALARWVREEGTGVVVDSPDRVAQTLAGVDLGAIRSRLIEIREDFTMEGAVGDLVAVYEELVGVVA